MLSRQTYRGTVIDAETGEPLEGAVFVIVWHTNPIVRMNGPSYFHSATETLTDAKGEFIVNGSPGIDWNPFTSIDRYPSIAIFKPGYSPFIWRYLEEKPQEETKKAMLSDGAAIKLTALKNEQEMRRYTDTGPIGIPTDVPYEKIPKLTTLINIHRKSAGISGEIGKPSD
jgi:hypothetical protein